MLGMYAALAIPAWQNFSAADSAAKLAKPISRLVHQAMSGKRVIGMCAVDTEHLLNDVCLLDLTGGHCSDGVTGIG